MIGKILGNIINRFLKADKSQGCGQVAPDTQELEPEEWPVGYSDYKIDTPTGYSIATERDIDYRKFRIRAYCNLKKLEYEEVSENHVCIFKNSKPVLLLYKPDKKMLIDALIDI